jgi:hypothetical protein
MGLTCPCFPFFSFSSPSVHANLKNFFFSLLSTPFLGFCFEGVRAVKEKQNDMDLFRLQPHDPQATDLTHDDSRQVLRQMQITLCRRFDHPAHLAAFEVMLRFLQLSRISVSDWINLNNWYAYFDEVPEPSVRDIMLRYGREWTSQEYAADFDAQITHTDVGALTRDKPLKPIVRQLVFVRAPEHIVPWMLQICTAFPIRKAGLRILASCLSENQLIAILQQSHAITQMPPFQACLAEQQVRRAHICALLNETSSLHLPPLQQLVLAYLDHPVSRTLL